MKLNKLLIYSLAAVIFAAIFTACTPDDGTEFDRALLIGKWQSGTNFEVYESSGEGYYWDEAEDITEEEAKKSLRFTWTLEQDVLTQIHISEMVGGELVPKVYTVTELTASTLSYEDDYGKTHTFTKVTK